MEGPPEAQGWLGQVGRSASVVSVQTTTRDMLGPLLPEDRWESSLAGFGKAWWKCVLS